MGRRRFRRMMAAFAVVALASGSNLQPASAITNGTPDGDGHPYVVALTDDYITPGVYDQFCTGTLVTKRLVVTAAHCLLGLVDSEIWVSFDSVYRPNVSARIHGTGIAAVDPTRFRGNAGAAGKYGNSDLGNDIAVVHLDEDAPISQFAELPTAGLLSSRDLRGQRYTVVGYGFTADGHEGGPNGWIPNRDPDVRNVATEQFLSLQSAVLTVSQNSSRGDGGVCHHDSGGPHFLGRSRMMVAITTLGDAACSAIGRHYRLDIPFARHFLASQGVPVP